MPDDRELRIAEAKTTFAETVTLKVRQLRRYVPKGSNSALTGAFIEELVRGFIQGWIGQWELLTGTLHPLSPEDKEESPFQIDGILYSPRSGPATIREGGFIVVHPAFSPGVVEIKTTLNRTMRDFEDRLKKIYRRHFSNDRSAPVVMGVVISDTNPAAHSELDNGQGGTVRIYERHYGAWCPIFTLFQEVEGEYVPFDPAIDELIKHIFALREPPGTGY
jgi:hypothetical protein